MNTTVAAHEPWSKRPRFAPRQLLDAQRLNAALDDELDRQRLLNVALHGWGVVFGFGVEIPGSGPDHRLRRADCVRVTCGLALDAFGRMLHTEDRWLSLAQLEGKVPAGEGTYTLLVHHAERLDPPDHACSGTGPQWREYGVVFTLQPDCKPFDDGCPDLNDLCLTRTDYVRRRIGSAKGSPGRSSDLDQACDRPGSLRPARCGSWCYDPAAGVPIACVQISDRSEGDETGGDTHGEETGKARRDEHQGHQDAPCLVIDRVCTDECSPVRHVYRSPLLHELLSCCDVDLPRVERVSWPAWWTMSSRPVTWDDFVARIQDVDEDHADDGFAIWFTRPVRTNTVTPSSAILTVLVPERRADYWEAARVPIAVHPLSVDGDLARGVQLVPTSNWRRNETNDEWSSFERGARFEITLRGQLIRDDCGHMLNAVPTDVGCAPCQGRPGDDVVWPFAVSRRRRPDEGDGDPYDTTPQGETT
ncbi:hypothetical protein [Kribbella sp. VKM Ac-2568]|uniref:hypothetical protein n=1 Tax=Kribbella sp. VKM Ac-2568 TaxID=2512219 RepID=UPI00104ED204|nr:hypothetical protein [Kribbella sp. VKM Ac-2568]TCM35975.1 hypothetical protein EV648_12323 [Kribbella sp. VKM Ac-2568]